MNWIERNQYGTPVPGTLYSAYFRLRDFRENDRFKQFLGDGKWVMGLLLPPFQRPLVWAEDQMAKFIDSARRHLPLGTYTINETFADLRAKRIDDDGREWYYGDQWLLDGQQRLTALERFFNDELRVHGCLWSEVSKEDQRQFLMGVKFPYYETKFPTLEQAAEYYDLMNYGGVAHKPDERAALKI